jgi:hypothetical protein
LRYDAKHFDTNFGGAARSQRTPDQRASRNCTAAEESKEKQ